MLTLRAACLFAAVPFAVMALGMKLGWAAESYRALALVCPAGVEPADCDETKALDIAAQPVAMATECGRVGQVLAVRLSPAPGERVKVVCERRKG